MYNSFAGRGIKFIFEDRIENIPEGPATVTTLGQKTIKADLFVSPVYRLRANMVVIVLFQVPARGTKPNTSLIATLGKGVLNEKNLCVKILPTLQLPSNPDIFAAGDIIDFPEQKQATKVEGHAKVIVANILSLMSGAPATKEYKGMFEAIVITNGKVRVPLNNPNTNMNAKIYRLFSERRSHLFRYPLGNHAWRMVRTHD